MSTTTIQALDTNALESLSWYLNVIDIIAIIIAGSKMFTKKILLSITSVDFKLHRFWPDHCVDFVLRLCANARSARITMAENDDLYPLKTRPGRCRLFMCSDDLLFSPTSMHLLTRLDIRLKDCLLLASNMHQTFPLLKHFTVECRGNGDWANNIAQTPSKLPSNLETLKITLIPEEYAGLSTASAATDCTIGRSRRPGIGINNLMRWLPRTLEMLEIAGNGIMVDTNEYAQFETPYSLVPNGSPTSNWLPSFVSRESFLVQNRLVTSPPHAADFILPSNDYSPSWPLNLRCLTLGAVTNLRFANNLPHTLEILNINTEYYVQDASHSPRMSRLSRSLLKLTITTSVVDVFHDICDRNQRLLIIDSKLPICLQSIHIDDAFITKPEGHHSQPPGNVTQSTNRFENDDFLYAFDHNTNLTSVSGFYRNEGAVRNLLPIITNAIITNNPLLQTNTTEFDSFYLDGGSSAFEGNWNSSKIRRAKSLELIDVHQSLLFNDDNIPFTFTTLGISFSSLSVSDGFGGRFSEECWRSMPRTLHTLKLGSIDLLSSGESTAWLPNSLTSIEIDMNNDDLRNVRFGDCYGTLGEHLPSSLKSISFLSSSHSRHIYEWISQMQHRVAYISLCYKLKFDRSLGRTYPQPVVCGTHPFQIIAPSCKELQILVHSKCLKYRDVDGQLDTARSAFTSLPAGIESLKISVPKFDAVLLMDHNDVSSIPNSLTRFHVDPAVKIVRFHPANLGMSHVINSGLEFIRHMQQYIIDFQIGSVESLALNPAKARRLLQEAIIEYYAKSHWVTGLNDSIQSPMSETIAPNKSLISKESRGWFGVEKENVTHEQSITLAFNDVDIQTPPSPFNTFSVTTSILSSYKPWK